MDARKVLPAGLVIDGKFRIERVIGAGGFGITYAAQDLGLNNTVALKEYYPTEIGVRDQTMSVRPKGAFEADIFERLRVSFVQEARTLAKFRHPSIVRVISVFEAHGTAYMAMEFEEGRSLKSWMRSLGRPPTQDEVDRIFAPLIDALEVLHNARFLHRDIAPDNIIIRKDGTPVLLDFGAARRVVTERSTQMTGLIKQGYSPQEQYTTDGKSQGPWTDIYALGATLYHVVTGSAPPESPVRFIEDTMIPAAQTPGDWRPEFLAGIDRAMAVRPQHRPQSLAELRPMLFGEPEPVVRTSRPRTILPPNHPDNAATRVADPAPARSPRAPEPAQQHYYAPPPQPPLDQGPSTILRVGIVAVVLGIAALGLHQLSLRKSGGTQGPVIATPSSGTPGTGTPGTAGGTQLPGIGDPSSGTGTPTVDPGAAQQQQQIAAAERRRLEDERRQAEEQQRRQADEQRRRQADEQRRQADERRQAQQAEDRRLAEERRRLEEERKRFEEERKKAEQRRQPDTRQADEQRAAAERQRVADEALRDGTKYVTGTGGVQIDQAKARAFFEVAANAGKPEAMSWLAQLLLSGQGGDKDVQGAIGWYQTAANLGYVEAMRRLGVLYHAGTDVPKEIPRSIEWFERAAQAGDVQSMVNLGVIFRDQAPDPAKARQWWERAAAAGHASAMREVGEIHQFGRGAEKNATTARGWYERSVTAGNQAAKYRLARLLDSGQGGAKEFPRAAKLLLEAAQNGIVLAQQSLNGNMATWARETRTELKRELQRTGFYNGALNDTWDDNARRATTNAIRGRT